ncbi:MAG: hypothetical protein QNK37_04990 [Acidobacteriota bacterium]|nr:hypothetical protein [Acidobacteriota bacterium]
MNLTCIPSGCEEPNRNFIEVKPETRGHSEGHPLSVRDLSDKLVVLLHDKARHQGCLAPCSQNTPVMDTVSAMRHYMINHWGTRPGDVDVLLAGGLNHGVEFDHGLKAHLHRLELDGRIVDARSMEHRPLGDIPRGVPAHHLYYDPVGASVELVRDETEPGGRAYQSEHEQVTVATD